jgi:hypothetical protein
MSIIIKYKENLFTCLLDSDDFEHFKDFPWVYRCGYASRNRRKADPDGAHWIHLHREVLLRAGIEIPTDKVVDHINHNKMDNRKSNLRVVSKSENSLNVLEGVTQVRRASASAATKAAALLPRTEVQIKTSKHNAIQMNLSGKNIHKGSENVISKKVINVDTGEVYSCIREAAEKNGLVYSTLKSRLNGSLENSTSFLRLSDYKALP